MKLTRLLYFLAISALTLIPVLAAAQAVDRTSYYTYGRPFFAEAHILPSQQADSNRLLVFYKTMYDFIDFKPLGAGRGYSGHSSIEVTLRDAGGVIRRRIMARDTAFVETFDATNSKNIYLNGGVETHIPKGIYDISVTLLNDHGNQVENINITADELSKSNIIFGSEARGEIGLFSPFILGGNVDYERQRANALVVMRDASGSYTYNLTRVSNPQSKINWPGDYTSSGSAKMNNSDISLIKYPGNPQPFLSYNNRSGNVTVAEIDLPLEKMNPGRYTLTLTGASQTGSSSTLSYTFDVLWETMPLYLRNIDEAVKVMEYVLTEEQYSILKGLSTQERFEYILNHFKAKDPTPETAYNEALAVYFKRADYSFFNYQTLTEKNGALTDRGKIHILFGPPEKISTDLSKGKTVETWRYNRINRIFRFEMVRNGIFQLVEVLTSDGKVLENQ